MSVRTPYFLLIGLLWALLTGSASAQESLDDLDAAKKGDSGAKKATAEVNGYLDNRFQYSYINPGSSLLSTVNQPSLQEILEGNIQLKINIGS